MNEEKAYDVLKNIARREGISVAQVIYEIDRAISETLETIHIDNDLSAIEKWEQIPRIGEIPTAIELLMYLSDKMKS